MSMDRHCTYKVCRYVIANQGAAFGVGCESCNKYRADFQEIKLGQLCGRLLFHAD